ncbi:MAG TPA: anhydro-N-acetylmuramic acid kinase [Gammaproteobacteria bacterium]|nr:anhydro-N-acetylmuramic acid kinase [Gammaproteobacteria bacterium]
MSELYIGLMSGTSIDGIDAALVDFSQKNLRLVDSYFLPYPLDLRKRILDLCQPGENEINRLGEMDVLLGKKFVSAVQHLLQKNRIDPADVRAIGSHGQTIRHHPKEKFTLQIGDPNIIAAETGITTISDFRRRDIAWGGQGAPLVPAFHQAVFSADEDRAIVNIGGIANVTLLQKNNKKVLGFDPGPGNMLLDAWAEKHLQQPQDHEGNWGRKGIIQNNLLNKMLEDPYFTQPPPKSSGREYFNLHWLQQFSIENFQPVDIQATLTELTAQSILQAIQSYSSSREIVLCGGGVHNVFLLERLCKLGTQYKIASTEKYGIHPDWVEAIAFAWLAKQTLGKQPGNLATVTGAKQESILGGVYFT